MKCRTLRFHTFDEVLTDARALLAKGYDRAGSWSLGQVADHLARVIELSRTGFPMRFPWPVRLVARWFYLGRMLRHQTLSGRMPAPKFLQPTITEDAPGVEALAAAIDRFQRHEGPLHPSPVFGMLTNEQWYEIHLWHCEHHFRFLLPREQG